jgi:predicted helicase
MTDFDTVLAEIRRAAPSEAAKGAAFERLMRAYLLHAPKYAGLIEKVWLWNDFPYRKGDTALAGFGTGHDVGIDLVALTTTGEYWAIQCKCYDEDTYIDKPMVDSFISASNLPFDDGQLKKQHFTRRLWISTSNRISPHAETMLDNQDPPVLRIGLENLRADPIDWPTLYHKGTAAIPPRAPKDHQRDALNRARAHFQSHTRGKLIMACGTGKTYTPLKIAA